MAEQLCRRQKHASQRDVAGQDGTNHLPGCWQALEAPANVFAGRPGCAEIGTDRCHIAFETGQTCFHTRIMRPPSVGSKHRVSSARHNPEMPPLLTHQMSLGGAAAMPRSTTDSM